MVPSGKMLSSSPSAKMHLIVPSGNLNIIKNIILHDLFSSIWEVLFYLVIGKFEDLKSIREGTLSSLGFCEVVHNLLVRVCLLNIVIVEIDNGVSIREDLPLDSIIK